MRKLIAGAALCGLLALASASPGQPPDRPRPRQGNLKVNDAAPDFTIKDVEGKETTRLADLQGKPVVLIFGSCT
jgi:cytochrome oxidase Cu insertion factor (SCO1/SenC/PrrC family)